MLSRRRPKYVRNSTTIWTNNLIEGERRQNMSVKPPPSKFLRTRSEESGLERDRLRL
jgi:hypothetical protein